MRFGAECEKGESGRLKEAIEALKMMFKYLRAEGEFARKRVSRFELATLYSWTK